MSLRILTYCAVDRFPVMKYLPKWLPGLKFHDIATKAKEYAKEVVVGPYEEIKAQVVGPIGSPSYFGR